MYEIVSETIKSATSIKLGEIFNNPKRYKENITKQQFPNFHIIQIQVTPTPAGIGTKRIQLNYLMSIQYRVAENTESITNLQQLLDEVGLKLCAEFTELDLERPTKTSNRYYEKIDGVLHFFFNIVVYAIPGKESEPKLQKYKLIEEVS